MSTAFVSDPVVLKRFDRKIVKLQAVIDRTEAILSKPFEAPGSFVTGRSNRSKSLDRLVNAENNRRSHTFHENQKAKADLKHLTLRRAAYVRGEAHENGQPRADRPSRVNMRKAEAIYAEFLRTLVKPGDFMAVAVNPGNQVRVKRLNAKTVTDESGTKWLYSELLPLNSEGQLIDDQALKQKIADWRAHSPLAHPAHPETPATVRAAQPEEDPEAVWLITVVDENKIQYLEVMDERSNAEREAKFVRYRADVKEFRPQAKVNLWRVEPGLEAYIYLPAGAPAGEDSEQYLKQFDD